MKQTNTNTNSTDNLLALLDDNSLIQLAEQYITLGNGKVLPEGAPYFIRLAELGYIHYLRWAAECYNHGTGCERNDGFAAKYYFESLLFENNELSKRALKALRPEWVYYGGDSLIMCLIKTLLCGDHVEDARFKIAELIMAGEIREYARETAYTLLKRLRGDWSLKNYRLGECLLYGIGCETNPFAAVPVLRDAVDDLEYDVDDIERGDTDWIKDTFHTASDYIAALEEARIMLTQAEQEAERLFDPFEGYFHGSDIFEGDLDDYEDYRLEQFEQEQPPVRIKRTGTS